MSRKNYYENLLEECPEINSYLTENAKEVLKESKETVYLISFLYRGIVFDSYIGETNNNRTRLLSHLSRFFRNKSYDAPYYWLGIPRSMFDNGEVKIDFRVIAYIPNLMERLAFEEKMVNEFINNKNSLYLQNPMITDGKAMFPRYYAEPAPADICIIPFGEMRAQSWKYQLKLAGIA